MNKTDWAQCYGGTSLSIVFKKFKHQIWAQILALSLVAIPDMGEISF